MPPDDAYPDDRQVDPLTNETCAYSRLKARGFCERGDIPDVYGVIKQVYPGSKGWEEILYYYFQDRPRPSAIVIEYIRNSRTIDLSNFSDEALRKLRHILTEIHEAGVCLEDLYPRNMMVQEGTDKVFWINFGSAQTFTPGKINENQLSWFAFDLKLMDEFIETLVNVQSLSFIV